MDYLTNEEILRKLGERLRQRRLERNLTVEDLAKHCGLNRKSILAAESGEDVRLSTLVKLLRGMGMLGALDAALPDTLPSAGAFSTRGKLRKHAYPKGSKHGAT
jgi:transcriptional regulator with XRE-family HTH domain